MAQRYNPPLNWPPPPQGWTPPPGWQPDPAWGPPPQGWQVWVGEPAASRAAASPGSGASGWRRWLWPAATVFALLVGIGIGAASAGGDSTTTTSGQPQATVTVNEGSGDPQPTVTVTNEVAGPVTTETVTAEPPKPKGSIPGDGIWLVGSDIRPGTYRGGGEDCYWARLSGTSGEFDDLIANGNPSGQVIVTIKKTDEAFESTRCGKWERVG